MPKPFPPGQSGSLWWDWGRGRKEHALPHLNCKNSSHERGDKSLPPPPKKKSLFPFYTYSQLSCPPCTLLAFVPRNFHQFASFLSDLLKAQQKLIESNTNFSVCCIIKCSAWCVRSLPVIKCQLQQRLVPPGSSCCHFHFPPRTKHLRTEKS